MIQEFKGHESAVNCCRFLPTNDPTTFLTASDDATINVYDLRINRCFATFEDYKCFDGIYQIAISPSGRYIFAATENPALKVFDLLGETNVHSLINMNTGESILNTNQIQLIHQEKWGTSQD